MAIIKRKRLLMEMLSFDRNRLMIAMFNPMEMISFDRKRLLMAMLGFDRKKTADGNAQFQPTCPLESRPTVGSDPTSQKGNGNAQFQTTVL